MALTPYFEDKAAGITLYHCRAEELLATLPPQSVDLVLTDPPYAEETHEGARSIKDTHNPMIDFDSISEAELRAVFDSIGAVSRKWVVSFMDWRHISAFEGCPPAGLRFVRFGIWVKPNGAPQFTGDRPSQGWEGIAIMHRLGGRMQWNGGGRDAVFNHPRKNELHKTAKPLPLVKELVTLFSNPGDLVVDPFMGGGPVARACKDLGRRFVGCDIDERWCEATARRLSQEVLALW